MEEKPWHKSYAPGVKPTLDYERVTLSEALTRSARDFPDRTALNYMGRRIFYRELENLVNRFARALNDLGVRPGDTVAVCLPNIPQVVITNLAAFRIGAVAAQNNPLYTERELAYQLNNSDARVVVTLSLLVPRMQKIRPQTQIEKIVACHLHSYLPFPKRQIFPFVKKEMFRRIVPTEEVRVFRDLVAQAPGGPVEERSRWEDLAALIYTGGTTGVSKGVMLSHANLSCNVQQFVAWFPGLERGRERLVGTFPIFHSAGFTAIQNFILWQAWENILIPRPEPKGIIDILKKEKPGWLPGVPTIFVGLLAEPEFRKMDLSFIRGFFSGAAPLAAETIRDLKELTGGTLCEVYGMTETTPVATVTPWGGVIKPGTVGVPVSDTDVRIVDLETGEKEMPVGEPGEIVIGGPQVMMGYYKKPEDTRAVLRDGRFYTGDIGVFDEDGYLRVVDRKKDMVIAGGFNIYPVEIDNILMGHPDILQACAVGIPHPYRGETIKAFVVVKQGATLTEAQVLSFCREKLAPYKVPKSVEFMDALPTSAVGKVLRRELRQRELEKTAQRDA